MLASWKTSARRPHLIGRMSNDNPYAESLSSTCKCRTISVPALRQRGRGARLERAVRSLVQPRANHSGLKLVTLAHRHSGVAAPVLAQREAVLRASPRRALQRWSRSTRTRKLKDEISLNPECSSPAELKQSCMM